MTLANTLRQQLSNPEQGGFHVSADGWSVTVAADKAESLSCALNELSLERAGAVKEELRAWANRVAEEATGLLEPLAVIEVDLPRGQALLRSETPTVQADTAHYYELELTRGQRSSATLRRYVGDKVGTEKREAAPFVLTHDAIVKLVTDILGAN
jgi:hypothetical protein